MDAVHTSPRPFTHLPLNSQVVLDVCCTVSLRCCRICPDRQLVREPLVPCVPTYDAVEEGPHVTTLHDSNAALFGTHHHEARWRCHRCAIAPPSAASNPQHSRKSRRTGAGAGVGHSERQVIKAEAFSQSLHRRTPRLGGETNTQRKRAQAAVFPSTAVSIIVGAAGQDRHPCVSNGGLLKGGCLRTVIGSLAARRARRGGAQGSHYPVQKSSQRRGVDLAFVPYCLGRC